MLAEVEDSSTKAQEAATAAHKAAEECDGIEKETRRLIAQLEAGAN